MVNSVQGWTVAFLMYWVVTLTGLFLLSIGGVLGNEVTYSGSNAMYGSAGNATYDSTVHVGASSWNVSDYVSVIKSFFLFSLDLGLPSPFAVLISVFFAWLPCTLTILSFYFMLRSGSQ